MNRHSMYVTPALGAFLFGGSFFLPESASDLRLGAGMLLFASLGFVFRSTRQKAVVDIQATKETTVLKIAEDFQTLQAMDAGEPVRELDFSDEKWAYVATAIQTSSQLALKRFIDGSTLVCIGAMLMAASCEFPLAKVSLLLAAAIPLGTGSAFVIQGYRLGLAARQLKTCRIATGKSDPDSARQSARF